MLSAISSAVRYFAATAQVPCPLGGGDCDTGLDKTGASSANLKSILQVFLAIIGVVSILMIVIAGIQFITAQGESSGVVRARKVIIFALVGLLIATSAEAIVTFVIGRV